MVMSRGNISKQVKSASSKKTTRKGKIKKLKKSNPIAKDLRTPKYRKRVMTDKKKKASKYKARKNKE